MLDYIVQKFLKKWFIFYENKKYKKYILKFLIDVPMIIFIKYAYLVKMNKVREMDS